MRIYKILHKTCLIKKLSIILVLLLTAGCSGSGSGENQPESSIQNLSGRTKSLPITIVKTNSFGDKVILSLPLGASIEENPVAEDDIEIKFNEDFKNGISFDILPENTLLSQAAEIEIIPRDGNIYTESGSAIATETEGKKIFLKQYRTANSYIAQINSFGNFILADWQTTHIENFLDYEFSEKTKASWQNAKDIINSYTWTLSYYKNNTDKKNYALQKLILTGKQSVSLCSQDSVDIYTLIECKNILKLIGEPETSSLYSSINDKISSIIES